MSTYTGSIALRSPDASRKKDAVILFHGLTGTPSEMIELAQFLHSIGFDCFAPCLSGHGSSVEELAKTPLQAWISDADAAVAALGEYRQVHLVGQSFGALLVLYLATKNHPQIASCSLLSLPWKFRSTVRELVLTTLANGPDSMLDLLGYQQKVPRPGVVFRDQREAYSAHSVAAGVRLVQLRLMVQQTLPLLDVPVLVLQDPTDHHLAPDSVWRFRRACPDQLAIRSRWIPNGQHELTIGPSYEVVKRNVHEFIVKG